MDPQDQLLLEIEEYLQDRKIAETTFGRLAVNDGKFMARLRGRANMTLATLNRVRAFISNEREHGSRRVTARARKS